MNRLATIAVLAVVAAMPAACTSPGPTRGPYQPLTEGSRDTVRAAQLTKEAEPLMASDPAKAEALLREALTADLYHGPAHNNLGVIFLRQQKYYEAAGEFDWAKKVMPGHPDPRFNLALTLESTGRTQDAIAMYDTALSVYPGHLPTTQALVRLQVKSGRIDSRTPDLLREVAMRSESAEWRDWARKQMASRGLE